MKKISLNLDALEIESFETAAVVRGEEGTVFAHAPKPRPSDEGTCFQATCVQDCYWTIWETCNCVNTNDPNCLA